MLGNKTKMIRLVLFAIIEPSCFSFFTWTGKAANGGTKNALKKCPQILQLIYEVIRTTDKSYEYSSFLTHLKEGIVKHAYEYVAFLLNVFLF